MSLLHPSSDDDAFAAGHADEGLRASHQRVNRLRELLRACAPHLPANSELSAQVAKELLEPDEWYT